MARMTFLVPVKTANYYVNNDREAAARSAMIRPNSRGGRRTRVIATQEFRKQRDFEIRGHEIFQCEYDQWLANNALILRKAGSDYRGHGVQQLTGRISKDPIGAPRGTSWVQWAEQGVDFAAFSAHAPAGARPQVVRARQRYMEGLLDLAVTQHGLGALTLIMGDLNDADEPVAMLKKANFVVVQNHFDYIAMKRRGSKFSLGEKVLIDQSETGSDHKWVGATVTVKA